MKNDVYEPLHLKNANKILEKHLHATQENTLTHNEESKETTTRASFLKKIWGIFKE